MAIFQKILNSGESIDTASVDNNYIALFINSGSNIEYYTSASGALDLTSVSTASYAGTSSFSTTASFLDKNELGFRSLAVSVSQSQAFKLDIASFTKLPGGNNYLSGYPDLIGFQTGSYWYLNYNYPAPYVGDETELCLYSGSYLIGYGFSGTTQGNYYQISMQISSSTGWQNFGDWKYGNDAYGIAANGGNLNWGGGSYIKDVIEATGSFVRIRWINTAAATIAADTALLNVDIKQLDKNHLG